MKDTEKEFARFSHMFLVYDRIREHKITYEQGMEELDSCVCKKWRRL